MKTGCRYSCSYGCRRGKELLASGWEYKTSYPNTISNMPHYILVNDIREKHITYYLEM
jgi:hypothetical protein